MSGPADPGALAAPPSPAALDRIVRRNTVVLAGCLAIGWAVVQLLAALGGVSVAVLTGREALAGTALAVYVGAWALASPLMGRFMDGQGRGAGIRLGFLIAGVGSIVAFFGMRGTSTVVFLAGLALAGAGGGTINLARAGGADMYPPERRARGISYVLVGAAFGAILGPLLFAPLLGGVRHDPAGLAAPWLVAAAVLGLGALLPSLMRVDPIQVGRWMRRAGEAVSAEAEEPPRPVGRMVRIPEVRVALLSVAVAQGVMTGMMAIAGVILVGHGHDLAAVSIALSVHFLGMFGLVLIVGQIVDRLGRVTSLVLGLTVLAVGVLTLLAGVELGVVLPAMFLVGIGWNLAFVAATAALADAARPVERGRLVGFGDLLAVGAGAVTSILAGTILGLAGLVPLVLSAAAVSLLPLLGIAVLRRPAAA